MIFELLTKTVKASSVVACGHRRLNKNLKNTSVCGLWSSTNRVVLVCFCLRASSCNTFKHITFRSEIKTTAFGKNNALRAQKHCPKLVIGIILSAPFFSGAKRNGVFAIGMGDWRVWCEADFIWESLLSQGKAAHNTGLAESSP